MLCAAQAVALPQIPVLVAQEFGEDVSAAVNAAGQRATSALFGGVTPRDSVLHDAGPQMAEAAHVCC